jgi:hypothetical protein
MTRQAVDNCAEEYDPHHDGLFFKVFTVAGLIVVRRKLKLLKCKLRVKVICS